MRIEIHLVDHCNLNCKYCSHFSSISDEWYLDPDQFDKDLSSINSKILNSFTLVKLLGGEPLLHPRIIDIIKILRKYYHNDVCITTNGILLKKMSKEFYDCCRENDIVIKYTEYPIGIDYEQLSKKIWDEHKVRMTKARPNALFTYKTYDLSGSLRFRTQFRRCNGHHPMDCMQLCGTKLFYCYRIPYIDIFNKKFGTNITIDEKDYIDLSNVSSIKEIKSYRNTPKPFCRYCNLFRGNGTLQYEFQKSTGTIDEWA